MERPVTCTVELMLENGNIEHMIEYLNEFELVPGKKIVLVDREKTTVVEIKTLPQ